MTLGEVVGIYEKYIRVGTYRPTYGKLQYGNCHRFIFDLVIFILCFKSIFSIVTADDFICLYFWECLMGTINYLIPQHVIDKNK